jgi:hypothetical protein
MPPAHGPFDPEKPYNDLPRLPPAADVETRAILKACIDARAAVAELKQALKLARAPLKQLRDIGVLTEIKAGREKLFIHAKLMTRLKSDEHVVQPYESRA